MLLLPDQHLERSLPALHRASEALESCADRPDRGPVTWLRQFDRCGGSIFVNAQQQNPGQFFVDLPSPGENRFVWGILEYTHERSHISQIDEWVCLKMGCTHTVCQYAKHKKTFWMRKVGMYSKMAGIWWGQKSEFITTNKCPQCVVWYKHGIDPTK